MQLIYDEEKLNSVLNDFYTVTHINVDFLDQNRQVLYRKGKKTPNPYCRAIRSTKTGRTGCAESDRILLDACDKSRHVEVHECHAGLIDAAVPILYNGVIAGYLIIGAMRHANRSAEVRRKWKEYGLHNEKMARYYDDLMPYDGNTIESIANITAILATYIMQESMLTLSNTVSFGVITDYIEQNLPSVHTYRDLTSNLPVSKSSLYRDFKKFLNCTPGEYILERKTERAKALLQTDDISIESISQQLGFSTPAYFGRVFKAVTSVSPSAYRKRHNHGENQ